MFRPYLVRSVASALSHFHNKWPECGTERRITCLLCWGQDAEAPGDDWPPAMQIFSHVHLLPDRPKPPIRVDIRGAPRSNAKAKDTQWVKDRKILEVLSAQRPGCVCAGGGAPLTHKRHILPHSAQPRHTNYWAPRTRKRHQQQHRPQRPTESSDPTQHAKGRTGDRPGPRKGATTRRNVTQGVGGWVVGWFWGVGGGGQPSPTVTAAESPRLGPALDQT